MLKNAWIAFAAFFALLWVGSIFLEQAVLLFVPGLLAAVVVACATRILNELAALRQQLSELQAVSGQEEDK